MEYLFWGLVIYYITSVALYTLLTVTERDEVTYKEIIFIIIHPFLYGPTVVFKYWYRRYKEDSD